MSLFVTRRHVLLALPQRLARRIFRPALPPQTALDGRSAARFAAAQALASFLAEIATDDTAAFRIALVPAGQSADLHLDVLARASVLGLMQAQEGRDSPLPGMIDSDTYTEPRLWIPNASRAAPKI